MTLTPSDVAALPDTHRAVLAACEAECWRNVEDSDVHTEGDIAADIIRALGRTYLGTE